MGRLIIHVGYPKVASTFLQDQLLARTPSVTAMMGNDGIILAERDDSPYLNFDPADRDELLKRMGEQIDKDPKPTVISHESLCIGDWMISYDFSEEPEAITERIKTYLPPAEIMLILRPQSNWFASWYRQHVSGGTVLSPGATLETDRWRQRVRPGLEFDRKVEHYRNAFGADKVKLFYYHDLRENQDEFVDEVYDYFGVEPPADYPHAPLNVTRSDPIIRAKLASNRLSAYLRDRMVRSPEGRSAWDARHHQLWKNYLNRTDFVIKRIAKKSTISPALKRQIDDMFAESNARLERIVGEDLRAKGFHVARTLEAAANA